MRINILKIFVSMLVTLWTVLAIAAESGLTELNSLGFYSVSNQVVPHAVKRAASSVFLLKILAAGSDDALRTIDVSNGRGKELKVTVQSLPDASFDKYDKIVLTKQIERCELAKDIEAQKVCPITFDIRQGTGFLLRTGATLWTNAHVIDSFLSAVQKIEGLSKVDQMKQRRTIRMFVFDQSGQLVLDPYVDEIVVTVIPGATPTAQMNKEFYSVDSDYVALALSKNIGVPLRPAHRSPRIGEKNFILGYSACTGCSTENFKTDEPLDFANRSPGPNSDGRGLKVTIGSILNSKELSGFFQMAPVLMNFWRLDQMTFSGADSQHGNSGGPWLNEAGEVLAIHTGGKSRMIEGKFVRVSRAVVPPQFLTK